MNTLTTYKTYAMTRYTIEMLHSDGNAWYEYRIIDNEREDRHKVIHESDDGWGSLEPCEAAAIKHLAKHIENREAVEDEIDRGERCPYCDSHDGNMFTAKVPNSGVGDEYIEVMVCDFCYSYKSPEGKQGFYPRPILSYEEYKEIVLFDREPADEDEYLDELESDDDWEQD